MNTVLTILVSLLIFGFLIMTHELGHFIAARKCGVTVEEFSAGMGPLIAQKKINGTDFSIRALPIGGFCKMKGEDEDDDSQGSLYSASPMKRIIILLAGAAMNLITAAVLFFAIYCMTGTDATTTLAKVSPGSPAALAGLEEGDTIISINSSVINEWDDITALIRDGEGGEVTVVVRKADGTERSYDMIPEYSPEDDAYLIGITPVIKTNVLKALGLGISMVGTYIVLICQVFGQLFSGKAGLEVFSGPVGAAAVIGEYCNYGLTYILSIAASIAVSLGFFNLLPIPALDGSRALFALYELIFKKHIDRKTEGIIHTVGFIILMAFGVLITFRDIINLRK